MAILPEIHGPDDVKKLSPQQCRELAVELRQTIIDTVSRQGGHLASNLGDIELTIALHRAFDSPRDKLIFDVGHQIYAHKLLTGRQDSFPTLRSYHGISGFPCRAESEHDLFDTGHSSTSISMALGMARARDLMHEDYHVVAIIGDGALTGGMSYEAMNDANGCRLIVVLNDNGMSISQNVGALSNYLKHLRASASWYSGKKLLRNRLEHVPIVGKALVRLIENAKNMLKTVLTDGQMFEALGFRYLGPFNGHDIEEMTHVFEEAKRIDDTPLLIHVITQKGHGYDLAERQPEKFHGVPPFRVENGLRRGYSANKSAAHIVGKTLVAIGAENPRIVAVTAAMTSGTGLTEFAHQFPERFFDVGIAEQHAVSMSAGLARAGMRPFFAVYATFLQRAYDQIVHDVCLQNLPVCILADHVGLVGDDGKTHHGVLTVPMLLPLPNMTLFAPRDTRQLELAIRASLTIEGPCVIQYPKEGIEPYAGTEDRFVPGKWQTLIDDDERMILSYGRMTKHAMLAAKLLEAHGLHVGVTDCASLKPMDMEKLTGWFRRGTALITIEEGELTGGFGAEIARLCAEYDARPLVCALGIGDRFILHGSVEQLLTECGLMPEQIAARVYEAFTSQERANGTSR